MTTASPTGFTRLISTMTGSCTLEEMQKDAERFFATLDLNHDGEIDPDEITHYENVVAPEVRSGRALRPGVAGRFKSRERRRR